VKKFKDYISESHCKDKITANSKPIFPEKEYTKRIFLPVHGTKEYCKLTPSLYPLP